MGIDAEILVRIKGRENWVEESAELDEAYRLASTIGARHFFIYRDNETGALKDHHALSIIKPENNKWGDAEPEHIGKVVFYQDGDPIVAGDDEQFLRVHLWSRYYGPEYPRGDWLVIRSVIWYLSRRFKGEVWYGGDSGGVCAQLMTPEVIAEFDDFFFENAQRPYYKGWNAGGFMGKDEPMECPTCKPILMTRNGWGPNYAGYFCDGCGGHVDVRDGEAKFSVPR